MRKCPYVLAFSFEVDCFVYVLFLAVTFGEGVAESDGRGQKSLLRFALRFYPLSSKFRIRSILPLPTSFVALRHFPRFIGEIYPEGESKSIRIRVNITLPSKISLPQAISLRNAKFHLSSGKYRCCNAGRRGVVPYG